MENNGAANTERALTLYNHRNQKTIKIDSLYIDFTMYGPFPTKTNNEVRDVAALNQSESSLKSLDISAEQAAHLLVQLSNDSSQIPETATETAAETGPAEQPRYVSLRDLMGENENQ